MNDMSELTANKLAQSREVVKEIMNFGVTQFQLINIIYLLSLELENRDAMLEIAEITKKFLPQKNSFLKMKRKA
jgi:hypothetical protein